MTAQLAHGTDYSISLAQGPDCGHSITAILASDIGQDVCVGYVYQCDASDEYWAFTWDRIGPPVLLALPPDGVSMSAEAIGPTGLMVVNIDYGSDGLGRLAHTLVDGRLQQLSLPVGALETIGRGTNGPWVVGYWSNYRTGQLFVATMWDTARGTVADLVLPMGPRSVATAVNASGHVCGWMGLTSYLNNHGFLVIDGQATDLGAIPGGITATPSAINASDTIVGSGLRFDPATRGYRSRGFVWSQGRMTVIEPPPGYSNSGLGDINDNGDVIGRFWNPTSSAGFLMRGGKITFLSDFVPPGLDLTVGYPHAIHNDGRIFGNGDINVSQNVVVLLTPIPPSPDLDSDGVVGGSDLAILLGAWGACDGCPADLDENGTVDAADLAILLGAWNG